MVHSYDSNALPCPFRQLDGKGSVVELECEAQSHASHQSGGWNHVLVMVCGEVTFHVNPDSRCGIHVSPFVEYVNVVHRTVVPSWYLLEVQFRCGNLDEKCPVEVLVVVVPGICQPNDLFPYNNYTRAST